MVYTADCHTSYFHMCVSRVFPISCILKGKMLFILVSFIYGKLSMIAFKLDGIGCIAVNKWYQLHINQNYHKT